MTNEYQKPYSEKARKNFDAAFCPFKLEIGENFELSECCYICKLENLDSYLSCKEKYKTISERMKP